MSAENFYEGREQTKIKHFILREYLERFALIVQSFANSITYIDCFSGPWNLQSQDFQDSSFAIAIDQLKRAKATLAEKGKQLALRCMFLEKDPQAFAKPYHENLTLTLAPQEELLEVVCENNKPEHLVANP